MLGPDQANKLAQAHKGFIEANLMRMGGCAGHCTMPPVMCDVLIVREVLDGRIHMLKEGSGSSDGRKSE